MEQDSIEQSQEVIENGNERWDITSKKEKSMSNARRDGKVFFLAQPNLKRKLLRLLRIHHSDTQQRIPLIYRQSIYFPP
jgi:hypothetical protein